MADLVMVVEVFISQRNADNPLHHQRLDRGLGVSGMRLSLKQAARRRVRPSTRSVAPSSNAPASLVMAPPSKEATTARPSARAKSNWSGLHCVGIGDLLCCAIRLCRRRTSLNQSPDAPDSCERCGLRKLCAARTFAQSLQILLGLLIGNSMDSLLYSEA